MARNLLIVESPAKAKTIEKFLGEDFKVESCYGHIRDLPKSDSAIDIENGYVPNYVVADDKKDLVKNLKKLLKEVEQVWLATDEDREGEAISWHLCEVLGLDPTTTKRIVFHEITKKAIQSAVESPRTINLDVVNAQQARRVLDRLVGFELSPVLWRKVNRNMSLSAGRVQSVAVRIIVEREKEIGNFEVQNFYKISALFDVKDKDGKSAVLKSELSRRLKSSEEAEAFLKSCVGANYTIADLQVKPAKKKPTTPFTTSTLQQEASRKLGYSVSKTMMVAQKLYEAGKITYMRTDSVNLSDTALEAAAAEINNRYGEKYIQTRKYTTKSKDAQEAHEAIRPTYMEQDDAGTTQEQKKLYSLIWKRTLASQMADAELERTTVKIDISTNDENLTAKGEVLTFDGFLKVYSESTDDEEQEEKSGMLPPLSVNQVLDFTTMTATERFNRPPARYTEASLVKKMEELGIGRPSTYAPTIATILKRKYIVKETRDGKVRNYEVMKLENDQITTTTDSEITGAESNKLFPTDMGGLVNDFLVEHFGEILNYSFTAQIEEKFDKIAQGGIGWSQMIDSFYKPFKTEVTKTIETADRVTGERHLGDDPATGKPIIVRLGKYGPMVQIGKQDDEEKPRFASLLPHQTMSTVTLEDAIQLFKLPRTLGEFEEKVVKTSEGRFGPYVLHNKVFASIPKDSGLSPLTITLEEAIDLIKAKREADAKKLIKAFDEDPEIKILNGRWGPYIKVGKKNVKLPKDIEEPKDLSFEKVKEIIENAPPPRRRGAKKK